MEKWKSSSLAEKLSYLALLVAVQVVLGNFLQIPLATKQYNLGFLPVAVAGWLFGPGAGMLVGALGDFIGANLFPAGTYFFGFTLTYGLVGLIYGLVLYRREPKLQWVVLACLGASACNLLLNTYWLTFVIPGASYGVLLAGRAPSYVLETPLTILCVYLLVALLQKAKLPFGKAHRVHSAEPGHAPQQTETQPQGDEMKESS